MATSKYFWMAALALGSMAVDVRDAQAQFGCVPPTVNPPIIAPIVNPYNVAPAYNAGAYQAYQRRMAQLQRLATYYQAKGQLYSLIEVQRQMRRLEAEWRAFQLTQLRLTQPVPVSPYLP
ncbi:MAG: hypothetical protein KatS3mg105_1292 [Gemmatales bacterium]|nr:MAG: hypothetical protein KatS3mg105_1292 [Gemmatales bacterium]